MAFATPMPMRSPRMRRHSSARSSPSWASLTASSPFSRPRSCASACSPRPARERLQGRGLGRARLRGGRAVRQVRADDLMPELRCRAGRAAVDAAVDHDAAADAGPDGQHHEMARDEGAVVRVGLGERRAVGVVVDVHRDAEPLAQQVAQRHACERDVHAEARRAGGEVDRARDGDADGVRGARRADGGHELLEELLLVVAVGRPAADLRQPRPLEGRDGDLRAADVHTDESLSHGEFLSDSA